MILRFRPSGSAIESVFVRELCVRENSVCVRERSEPRRASVSLETWKRERDSYHKGKKNRRKFEKRRVKRQKAAKKRDEEACGLRGPRSIAPTNPPYQSPVRLVRALKLCTFARSTR
eukprot:sb/3476510/